VAPLGTITLSVVDDALVTSAFTAPKYTMLFAATELNPDPLIVTIVPTGPDAGEKLLIEGCAIIREHGNIANKKMNNRMQVSFERRFILRGKIQYLIW
jgi:hypothetical protein